MSKIDPAGTAPGLAGNAKPGPKIHHIKCRVEGCSSLQAIEITPEVNLASGGVPHHRTYQCVQCKNTWSMAVGGFVNL